jgi:hypothetical protein
MSTAKTKTEGRDEKTSLIAKLKAKKRQSATHEVVLDHAPLEALRDARLKVESARTFGRDVEAAEREVTDAEAAVAASTVVLHLRALSRDAYEQLLREHPPTEKQKADRESYDLTTFMPALIAATLVDPESEEPVFDASEVSELIADWNQAETATLWNAAVSVCTRNPTASLSLRMS